MSVRKRRKGDWYFRKWVRLPDGTSRRVFGVPGSYGLPNTKVAAEEAMRRAIAKVLDGKEIKHTAPIKRRGKSVAEFADLFLAQSKIKNKQSSFESNRTILKLHILPSLGEMNIADLTFGDIEDFKAELAGKGLKAKTINNVLSVANAMLAYAEKRGEIEEAPDVGWLKSSRPKFDFLDFAESEALINAADGEWRTMILVALRTGMRMGELIGLRWDDVDLKNGKIYVSQAIVRNRLTTPKSHKSREIPLSADTIAALKAHRHMRGEYVFCDQGGRHLTKGECKWPLWRASRLARIRRDGEIQRLGWHVLRHTFASQLAMRGATLPAIQAMMGHSTIQMTMRYAHLSPSALTAAVSLLDAGFGAQLVPEKSKNDGKPRK